MTIKSSRLTRSSLVTSKNQEQEFTLKSIATPTEEGFEILAINEGEAKGHGIRFNSLVLQEALPLYENKPVFIDHAGLMQSPSVRNLAGTLLNVTWNTNEKGIQANLKPAGPSADVLLSIRDAAKTNPAIMSAIGFSTVLRVQLERDGNVKKIVSVKSVDVVVDPARGGKFLSEIYGERSQSANADDLRARRASSPLLKGVKQMATKKKSAPILDDELSEDENDEQSAALELQGANEIMANLQKQQEEQTAIHIANLRSLLDTSLAGSKLPTASQKAIRKPFEALLDEGKTFVPTQLQEAIKDKREEVAALTSADNVQGPGRAISLGFNSAEQFALAVADLFGLPREQGQENIKVHKLRGIQDAYLMATGDQYFTGGYFPEFALVTANFPGIVANVQNKLLIDAWKDFEQHYGWWKKIVTVEHFNNLNTATWVRTGTIASLPSIAERGEYGELAIGDIKETSEWGKYGGYVPLTIEAVLRDDLRAFKRMPSEVALAGMRNISEQVAAIFTQASGAGPTMTDTGALFNSTAQTTAGGHANLRTTALGTDYTEWNAIALAMFQKKLMVKNAAGYYGTGKQQALWPSIILVPAALRGQAETLFVPRWEAQAQNVSAVAPSWGGRVEVVTVPDWTDATDFAAVIDPKLRPGVMLGEIFGVIPQIFSASSEIDPAMFANDESRIKVRHFINVGVADDLPLHKSNVAG